jgi:transcriptional regulator with XRE-family HTH domain
MEFNEKLQELRKARSLTQEELAEAAFAVVVGATVLCGLCEVATANLDKPILSRRLLLAGTVLSVICVAVFIATRQPYAGIVCFALLVTKSLMLSKHVR